MLFPPGTQGELAYGGAPVLRNRGRGDLAAQRPTFDEMRELAGVRPAYRLVEEWLQKAAPGDLERCQRGAELLFRRVGITFAVYTDGGDPERLIPFDIIPGVIDAEEWARLSASSSSRPTG